MRSKRPRLSRTTSRAQTPCKIAAVEAKPISIWICPGDLGPLDHTKTRAGPLNGLGMTARRFVDRPVVTAVCELVVDAVVVLVVTAVCELVVAGRATSAKFGIPRKTRRST